ncbi:calcium-binding protein [Methylocucumis oryzae]|uniref:Haemolysin-type calcium binding-related domain-containing protein n=1 Tax=Methylocucumis oryzae TaxID=1632867 RepID=A0A0F3IM20_9GAMM|nr:hypothetical protein [Methylocucumis oryzae]KJV07786.1 hypothetical protein VZ94_02385 [Methylocucumis oryzae]
MVTTRFYVNKIATVYGGLGNDKIFVNNASGGSWLEGGLGNDSIEGGAGPDTIFSGYGNDTLKGGAGNDAYVVTFDNFYTDDGEKDTGYDTIVDTGGVDTIYFIRDYKEDGRDDDVGADGKELDPTVKSNDYFAVMPNGIENGVLDSTVFVHRLDIGGTYTVATLVGNSSPNVLTGSDWYDVLDGAGGNDTIYGLEGNDIIYFGEGNDKIDGGAGEDWVYSRKDFNLNKDGVNFENIDLLEYSTAITAIGDNFDNILVGNSFNNKLIGLAGNDVFGSEKDKATGTDKMTGGAGDDLYYVDSTDDEIIEIATTGGNDTIRYAGTIATTTYILPTGVENLVMVSNLIHGVGNNLNNKITGSSAANTIEGGYGDDYLDGGSGIDTFVGGYGDDTYVVDKIDEKIVETEGQGSDWVQSSAVTLDLNNNNWGGSIENARLTGTTSLLNLFGSAVNNQLIGNSGSNLLDGKGGKDTLEGGLGDDIYVVDTITDSLIEVVNSVDATTGKIKAGWIDTIQSSVNFSLEELLNFENITLTGTVAKTATGNTNDNTLIGNDIANTLYGLKGNDILEGGGGVDTLVGGKGNDTYRLTTDGDIINELAGVDEGNDTIEIQTTYSLAAQKNVENLTLIGTLVANATGTDIANKLVGNSAANILTGLDGNDTLVGGEGADTIIGGKGSDSIDLTESAVSKDVVRIGAGESDASVTEADTIAKFAMLYDTLDLVNTKIASNTSSADGIDKGVIESHTITNGIIKFDDADTYVSALSISSTNLPSVLEYLKANIINDATVAFVAGSDTWVFQDNGATDTLVKLLGISTATSVSSGSFSSTAIHIA